MSQTVLSFPITNFRHITQACRADVALEPDSPRFLDLRALRADVSIVDELADSLEQELEKDEFHRCLLSGHRGSGKSTELLQLKAWADENGFLCLHVEVDTYLGKAQLEFSDLYLLAAQAVLKEMESLGNPLPSDKIDAVVKWFAEVTNQDLETVKSEISVETGAEIGSGIPLLGKLIARFSASADAKSEHQQEVRSILRRAPDQLIDYTNDLLRTANKQLSSSSEPTLRRENGLLLLFDNLDRYQVEALQSLLTQGATLMRHLACHTIYTIPVELRCRANNNYFDEYDSNIILPMPALRRRGEVWVETVEETPFYHEAVEIMRALLEKRIVINVLFEREEDATLLVKMSGGCVRDLMHLVTFARQRSGGRSIDQSSAKITTIGVQRAIRDLRDDRVEGLLEKDYPRLVQIARRTPESLELDDQMLSFLGKRCVLQYKDEEGRWLDIHPLLLESEGFRRVWSAASVAPTG